MAEFKSFLLLLLWRDDEITSYNPKTIICFIVYYLFMYVKTWEFSNHFYFQNHSFYLKPFICSLFFYLQLDSTNATLGHNNSHQLNDVRFERNYFFQCEFHVNSGCSKVLDLGSLFNRYPSYSQRPIYGGYGGYGNNNFYPGGGYQSGIGGGGGVAGYYPNNNGNFYPGSSGLGTNFLGWTKQMRFNFQKY